LWVEADLCSACKAGWNGLIRVKRGNNNIASITVGGRTLRASCTASELRACNSVAEKALLATGAKGFRVERYQSLSMIAGRAALYLEF
jgi:hypothetical protein